MTTVPGTAAILFAGAATAMISSGFLLYAMIGEVNRKLSDADRVPYFRMYPGKVAKVKREYKRFYPNSRMPVVRLVLNALGIILMIIFAVELGIFR